MRPLRCAAAIVLLAAACEGRDGDVLVTRARPGTDGAGPADGAGGAGGDVADAAPTPPSPTSPSSPPDAATCPGDLEPPIYTLDATGRLAAFWPAPARFGADVPVACQPRGVCPVSTFFSSRDRPQPMSMAIDARGRAWILYCSGELFEVDLRTGACTATTFVLPAGSDRASMAHVEGGPADALYVALADAVPIGARPGGASLGLLRLSTMQIGTTVRLPSWPALTGGPGGELWGLFGGSATASSRVARLDPSSGAELSSARPTFSAPPELATPVLWRGALWVFFSYPLRVTETTLYRMDLTDGRLTGQPELLQRAVLAAAAGPCAGP